MALERKRQQAQDFASEASSSSSARPRQSANVRPPVYAAHRSESPPASAYFSHFSGDHHFEPQPTRPDANAHFSYSTTLRRHTVEGPLGIPPPSAGGISSLGELKSVVETEGAKGLWERTLGPVVAAFSGRDQYERLPTHREREQDTSQKESASARFAHYSTHVRLRVYIPSLWRGLTVCRIH